MMNKGNSSQDGNDYEHLLKILLIGNSGVGKSCMLMRYSDNNFTNNFYNTIGVDFTAQIDGKMLKMQIWDTAGQDRFRTITNSYYKGAHGIIVVYDITDKESFENIKIWMQEIEKYAQPGVIRLLVGNKSDLNEKRKVNTDEGQALAEHYEINFIETSAKSSANIENAFHDIARTVIKTKYAPGPKKDNLKLKESAPINQSSCC